MSARDYLKKWTPGGSQTRSKQDLFPGVPVVDRAQGSHVWWGSQEYVDWIAALAAVGLGYRYPAVEEAVDRQREKGTVFPLPTLLEAEVAEQLIEAIGFGESVRWVKTGSEATAAAMFIARRATGRKKVVSIGYHGWHETHLPSDNLVDVPWGSLAYSDEIDCQTAAVLLEPMRDYDRDRGGDTIDGYILDIQEFARSKGALFIMDEMVTGFRWAIGGASDLFGITPDLACYGKAMANGYPLACVVGNRALMKNAHDVSSTFGGECLGLAAAQATISVYRKEGVVERIAEVGKALMAGVLDLEGWPQHPHFPESMGGERVERSHRAAERGVLCHPAGMNPMFSHTREDIEKTIEALSLD